MQKAPTRSEAVALEVLSAGKWKVECQSVFGFYILDFVLPEKMLCIEIDGSSHNEKAVYDWKRDNFVKKCGLRVLRLNASQAHLALVEAAKVPDAPNYRERWRTAQTVAFREKSMAMDREMALGNTGRKKKKEKPLYTPKREQAHVVANKKKGEKKMTTSKPNLFILERKAAKDAARARLAAK